MNERVEHPYCELYTDSIALGLSLVDSLFGENIKTLLVYIRLIQIAMYISFFHFYAALYIDNLLSSIRILPKSCHEKLSILRHD
jgi:hypothetical protein